MTTSGSYTDGTHGGPVETQHLLACLDCGELAPRGDQPGEGKIVAAENGDAICDECARHRDEIAEANRSLMYDLRAVAEQAAQYGAYPEEARALVYATWSEALNGHGPLADYYGDDQPPIDDDAVRAEVETTLARIERDFLPETR